ncbi:YqzE family protein [Lederbergia sp. NSJ-179]|uniref:YqzE family protein n=1 Tax=Lederbergia sp. NSJ-179 TaxID=2931402 RepID=UPI001FD5BD92|nr:YqzE family protein [Lederbergia sp. NSJ-179]MCJ7839320.1 YqzE family protein [Lederbergia sp. NSJ-179]
MSFDDYMKYMTETCIKHFERPKAERKQMRLERKKASPPKLYQWFGLVPYSIRMIFKR